MKKSFMTRALAMGLSLAMAFSLSAATNVSVASAAAKPAMKSTKMTLKVGQSKNYQATAATQKAYKISGVKLSAAGKTKVGVTINSSKKSIKVTGKAATKSTNVVITFKNNSTKKSTKVTTKAVVKANVPTLVSVKQDAATKLTATLAAPVEKVDGNDVKIVRDDNHTVIAVKSVTIDAADATKLNIETFVSMTDGKSYTVTYTTQTEDKTESSASFTATDGKIADFAVTPETIPANKATTIKYRALDANGIVIYEKPISDKATGIDIDVTSDNGYLDNDKLVLMEVGNTAKLSVSYHTYQYDTEGNETGLIKKEFTITAVDASATASKFNYTIVSAGDTPAWENFTANTRVALKDEGKVARFQIKDSNGDDITNDCGYTVESSNPSVVIASGDVKEGATLVPVAEGSAYLVLKDKEKTVTTLAITVVKARTLANFTLDKTSIAIATDAALDAPGSASISYTAKDQYGDDIPVSVGTPECKSSNSADASAITTDADNGIIKIATSTAKAGTYTYNVTATAGDVNRTRAFTVIVKAPNTTTDYMVQFVKGAGSVSGSAAVKSVDTTVTKDTTAGSTISVNLVTKSNGVISGPLDLSGNTVSLSAITVKGSDGKTYAASGAGIKPVTSAAIANVVVSGGANGHVLDIVASTNGSDYKKNLPAGSYTVTLKLNDTVNGKIVAKTVTGTFKVEDKQPALTATVLKTDAGTDSNIETIFGNKDYVKYVYGGITQNTDANNAIDVVKVYGKTNGKTAVITKATIKVKAGGSNTVEITVPVNRVFTTTSDSWTGVTAE